MPRTAFLAYVRVLLCLQSIYLTFQVWKDFSGVADVLELSFALIGTYLGLVVLWAAGAGALGNLGRYSGGQGEFRFFALATLSLVAMVGLTLRPSRVYAGFGS
jgi:hypothetical protein